MQKLWGGRFSGATDVLIELLNNSLAFDARLWRQAIRGSIAHVLLLCEAWIIPGGEASEIADGREALCGAVETPPAAPAGHAAASRHAPR